MSKIGKEHLLFVHRESIFVQRGTGFRPF